MAITNPLDPDYVPVPVPPPGGLLTQAVGTPAQPAPPIDPKTFEDDDVVTQLNKITSQDSDYMKLARTSGLQTANRRGLLNSSIAATASQAAAIAAAAPLASQNASQAATRNNTRVGAHFAGEQQQADIANSRFLQQNSIAAQEKLAQMNIAAESERLGRQLTYQEQAQQRDIAANQANLERQIANQQSIANLDAQTRVQMQTMQNLTSNQQAALQYYLGQDQIYAQSVGNLYANKDIPAPARNQAIQMFTALKNSQVDLPSALFGIDLKWNNAPATTRDVSSTPLPVPATTSATRPRLSDNPVLGRRA
jgi:hypothetical protein